MEAFIKRGVGVVKRCWPLLAITLIAAVAYSLFSILRHFHFGSSGYDLGIFDQAIWHYSRFEAPASTTRGVTNLLGDHFSPILVILAPLYWLFNSVYVLLVAQGVLFALAIIPIWLFVKKRLGQIPAYCFVLSYTIYWGVQHAVAYDFHEVAFAVPLIAFAIYFMDSKKWRHYFVCIFLLLLVKENLSILVAFFGLFLLTQRHFKQGIASFIAGIAWFFLAIKVFIPFFAGPGGGFAYWSFTQFGPDPIGAIKTIIGNPFLVLGVLVSPLIKVKTGFMIFYPFALLAFFSPLILLAVPLIAERFLSTRMEFWVRDFHYTATLAPILVMASADGLWNISKLLPQIRIKQYAVLAVSLLVLLLNIMLLPYFPLWGLTKPSYYQQNSNDAAGYAALKTIPSSASVVAQGGIIPHLTHRQEIYQLNLKSPDADYVIASKSIRPWPMDSYAQVEQYLNQQKQRGYREVFSSSGWTVLSRH